MGKADRLSRRLDWKVRVENHNKNKKTNKKRIASKTSCPINFGKDQILLTELFLKPIT